MSGENKPCPFCGKKPKISPDGKYVYCNKKKCIIYARAFNTVDWDIRKYCPSIIRFRFTDLLPLLVSYRDNKLTGEQFHNKILECLIERGLHEQ